MGAAELSEMRRVCVMFVDIRSFTTAARSRTPRLSRASTPFSKSWSTSSTGATAL
jgi:hypothetical protein